MPQRPATVYLYEIGTAGCHDDPGAYLAEVYAGAERFWNPHFRWADRARFGKADADV